VRLQKPELSTDVVKSKRNGLFVVTITSLVLFVVLICVLILADIFYLLHWNVGFAEFWEILTSPQVLDCLRRSFVTSFIALLLIVVTAVPVGYALSRYRFFGHSIINTFVDMPIVLPPVVLGISLLAFFGSPLGSWIKEGLQHYGISLVSSVGIVMCQYIVSVSYCIRAVKASFDNVDRHLEHAALTLGCSQGQAFWCVTLPLARNGLIAGGIMAWARAIGVFGPLMVFVGTGSRVQVMPTNMWLELNVGNIENALVVSLITMAIASIALVCVHCMAPGRKWV
jgi:molybdate transport system permease protein